MGWSVAALKNMRYSAALLDDLAGAGGHGVVGAGLRLEGDYAALFCPRARGRGAFCLHGQVGEGRRQVGRRRGVRRAHVEHVPGCAVAVGRGVGGRGRVVLPGLAQFQHWPLLLPVNQVLARGRRRQPAGGSGRIIVHVVEPVGLVDPHVSGPVDVAPLRAIAVAKHDALIGGIQSAFRRRATIGIQCAAGRFRQRSPRTESGCVPRKAAANPTKIASCIRRPLFLSSPARRTTNHRVRGVSRHFATGQSPVVPADCTTKVRTTEAHGGAGQGGGEGSGGYEKV